MTQSHNRFLQGDDMHKVGLPQSIRDRITERRGRRHVWHDLAPERTALIVIDMQNHFIDRAVG